MFSSSQQSLSLSSGSEFSLPSCKALVMTELFNHKQWITLQCRVQKQERILDVSHMAAREVNEAVVSKLSRKRWLGMCFEQDYGTCILHLNADSRIHVQSSSNLNSNIHNTSGVV